jgi:hypothetical protein
MTGGGNDVVLTPGMIVFGSRGGRANEGRVQVDGLNTIVRDRVWFFGPLSYRGNGQALPLPFLLPPSTAFPASRIPQSPAPIFIECAGISRAFKLLYLTRPLRRAGTHLPMQMCEILSPELPYLI